MEEEQPQLEGTMERPPVTDPDGNALFRALTAKRKGKEPDPADIKTLTAWRERTAAYGDDEEPWPDPDTEADKMREDPAAVLKIVDRILPAPALNAGTSSLPLADKDRRHRQWLIPHWLPAGTIGMMTGAGGAGKSLLALQLAMALASGQREWIGRAGDRPILSLGGSGPQRVVYATYEDELEIEIADRMDWIEAQSPTPIYDQLNGRLHIEPMTAPIWSPPIGATRWEPPRLTETGRRLRALCQDPNAQLLIIDPMAEATVLDENDNGAIGDFIRSWRVWARTQQCAVMFLHHLAKHEALSKTPDDLMSGYRGASALQAGVRWQWTLQADRERATTRRTAAQLRPLKSSYATQQEPVSLYRDTRTHYIWQAENEQAAAGQNAQTPNAHSVTAEERAAEEAKLERLGGRAV